MLMRLLLAAVSVSFFVAPAGAQRIPNIPPGPLINLHCRVFGCNPRITSAFANVTPGGFVVLGGTGFGEAPSHVMLNLRKFDGTPFPIDLAPFPVRIHGGEIPLSPQ
jgi:hypothetical protein